MSASYPADRVWERQADVWKRNATTETTWVFEGSQVQLKKTDGSLVLLSKGSIVSFIDWDNGEECIVRITGFGNSGRLYKSHPIGFLYERISTGESGSPGRPVPLGPPGRPVPLGAIVGFNPGSESHTISSFDLNTAKLVSGIVSGPCPVVKSP